MNKRTHEPVCTGVGPVQVRAWAMHLYDTALLLLIAYTCKSSRARPRRCGPCCVPASRAGSMAARGTCSCQRAARGCSCNETWARP